MRVMSEGGEMAMWLAVGGFWAAVLLGPIGQALAHRIRGKAGVPQGITTAEVNAERFATMEDKVLELEAERGLLEERLDFAERMLAQPGDRTKSLEAGTAP